MDLLAAISDFTSAYPALPWLGSVLTGGFALGLYKDCSGQVIKFTKIIGEQKTLGLHEVLDLGWSHYPESKKRDIPRGASFHMDVLTLLLPPTGGSALFWEQLPTNLRDFFFSDGGRATYVFEIRIVADNARPRRIPVEFTFDPERQDLKVIWRKRARYPFWMFWRRWQL